MFKPFKFGQKLFSLTTSKKLVTKTLRTYLGAVSNLCTSLIREQSERENVTKYHNKVTQKKHVSYYSIHHGHDVSYNYIMHSNVKLLSQLSTGIKKVKELRCTRNKFQTKKFFQV